MSKEIIATVYESWIESKDYFKESALESDVLRLEENILMGLIDNKNKNDASDFLSHIGYMAERDGFEYGFRKGVLFMMDMMKGGICNE